MSLSATERVRASAAPLGVFAVMLSGMVVLPALRPLLAARGAGEGAMHAFLSAGMFGAVLLVPLFGIVADRVVGRRSMAIALLAVDAAAALACAAPAPLWVSFAARFVEGAANVGALSMVMSLDPSPHGRGMAAKGTAMMAALVVGSPLGGLLLGLGARAPFAAAAVALTLAVPLVAGAPDAARPSPRAPVTASPSLFVACGLAFAERFSVGAFVVTFALRAHSVLGMSDRAVSMAYAAMLVPFAAATYPVARLANRLSRGTMVLIGSVTYAAAFAVIAIGGPAAAVAALAVAGVASALVYAPALCYAATASSEGARGTRMALFHAAGCLGMALGPAFAGILGASLRRAAIADGPRHAAVLLVAGLAPLTAAALLRRHLATPRAAEGPPDASTETTQPVRTR
ncbi:MAG: MFS transporter [Myxococcales bacterium]|nr:MFS transporter [Myxococcales bacterium]